MKPIRSTDRAVNFHLGTAERRLFGEILGLYPVVPGAYQPLSKSLKGRKADEDQVLLNEALAEQRAELKRQIQSWLGAKNRFRRVNTGFNFTLQHSDAEWLLQVLNDVRIGSWLLLGSPEEQVEFDELAPMEPESQRAWAAMELCGMFQMAILQGLENQPPG